PPTVFIGERNPAELIAANVTHSIMESQSLVDKRVVRRKKVEGAAVFANDAFDEQFHFAPKGDAQVLVECGKYERIRLDAVDASHIQPLESKVRDERCLRLRIGNHSADLLFERRRIVEFSLRGYRQ